jgi:hypothetical protein
MSAYDNELVVLREVVHENRLLIRGLDEKLSPKELALVLSQLLFEATDRLPIKLVEVRDRIALREKGPFKYSGQAETLMQEGLMPQDVHEGLRDLGIERHIGPSYLRVKSLLTDELARRLFGRQLALAIQEYLHSKPLEKSDGLLVCIPNMTGGAWIGDETRIQLHRIGVPNVWPVTPYARETRKPIDAVTSTPKMIDYIEGMVPAPEATGAVFCFEELRTASETTSNALKIYRQFGYRGQNNVRLTAVSVFDYRHPVGVERLRRLGVDGLYLVSGKELFAASRELGYISTDQYETAIAWLTDPWGFTREVMPDIAKLQGG